MKTWKLTPPKNARTGSWRNAKKTSDSCVSGKSVKWNDPTIVLDKARVEAQLPLKACWEYYSKILKEQNQVVKSQSDENAFIYGLERFPELKRVTVTPAAHGWLFASLYETPMIRAFPYGFNYPIPRGWADVPPHPLRWSESNEQYKDEWRGVRIALRILSQYDHHVSELSFDANQLGAGINYMIFDQPCEEYDHFVAIMKRPGFQYLDLSLLVGVGGTRDWAGLRSGNLHRALSEAKELKHMSLSTTSCYNREGDTVPLKTIFPLDHWPQLRHFGFRTSISPCRT